MSSAGPVEVDFSTVTELAGTRVSQDQVDRLYSRYRFAADHCRNKDVLELACGTGQGLGYLAGVSRKVVGGDLDEGILARARRHYGNRLEIARMDAQQLPLPDASFDVLLLYEAIYYLPEPERFFAEAARVLRPGGILLICTANRDLPDFNRSPYSHLYPNPQDFVRLLSPHGFRVQCFGAHPVPADSLKHRVLRLVKRQAVRFHLIPQTMRGKEILKRVVFGRLVEMPAEIGEGAAPYEAPVPIPTDRPDAAHRVLYCVATLKDLS